VSKYCTPKSIRTGLKSGSCKPPIYDILRNKKFKKLKSRFLTVHPKSKTMVLHMHAEIPFFSPNNTLCVPRVFLPIKVENNYIIKAFLSISSFKNTWGKTL